MEPDLECAIFMRHKSRIWRTFWRTFHKRAIDTDAGRVTAEFGAHRTIRRAMDLPGGPHLLPAQFDQVRGGGKPGKQ